MRYAITTQRMFENGNGVEFSSEITQIDHLSHRRSDAKMVLANVLASVPDASVIVRMRDVGRGQNNRVLFAYRVADDGTVGDAIKSAVQSDVAGGWPFAAAWQTATVVDE